MYQNPVQGTENSYEGAQLQHQAADDNYDRRHANYNDEPRGSKGQWWRFWRRNGNPDEGIKGQGGVGESGSSGDPRREADFTAAVNEWIQSDGSATDRSGTYQALMSRFADVPEEHRRQIMAGALRAQGREDGEYLK